MSIGVISTWRMSFDGLKQAFAMLQNKEDAADAVEVLIRNVEDFPFYKSVGYGGLPNKFGEVETDAAFMDGNTLDVGAIGAAKKIKNSVSVARDLAKYHANNFLVGDGADKYAKDYNFETTEMLTDRAKKIWENRIEELKKSDKLSAYDGHDTVGAITLDDNNKIVVATSTSGLFMKEPGRVGDSPLCGCGFYADSNVGGAVATGLGEDIMKGVLSYEIVRKMDGGMSAQDACDKTVYEFAKDLKNRNSKVEDLQISVVAMDKDGNWGVATTVEFTFCIANEEQEPEIFISWPDKDNKTKIEKVSQEWLDAYEVRIHAEV